MAPCLRRVGLNLQRQHLSGYGMFIYGMFIYGMLIYGMC